MELPNRCAFTAAQLAHERAGRAIPVTNIYGTLDGVAPMEAMRRNAHLLLAETLGALVGALGAVSGIVAVRSGEPVDAALDAIPDGVGAGKSGSARPGGGIGNAAPLLVGLEREEAVGGIEALGLAGSTEGQEGEECAVRADGEAGEGVGSRERDGAEPGFSGDGVPFDESRGGGEPGVEDAGVGAEELGEPVEDDAFGGSEGPAAGAFTSDAVGEAFVATGP